MNRHPASCYMEMQQKCKIILNHLNNIVMRHIVLMQTGNAVDIIVLTTIMTHLTTISLM